MGYTSTDFAKVALCGHEPNINGDFAIKAASIPGCVSLTGERSFPSGGPGSTA